MALPAAGLTFASAGRTAAAEPDAAAAPPPANPFNTAIRHSIGAPARAELGQQATVRLPDGTILMPQEVAATFLRETRRPVPPGLLGMVVYGDPVQDAGVVRFVPSGFIDATTITDWSSADILASINDALAQDAAAASRQDAAARAPHPDMTGGAGFETLQARAWVRPPHYDPAAHVLSWAALILPQSAPAGSDGAITFHAVSFGRSGFIEVTVPTDVERAAVTGRLVDTFMSALSFRPGEQYADVRDGDPRAPSGLAAAFGIPGLRDAARPMPWSRVLLVLAGVGLAGALALVSRVLYRTRKARSPDRPDLAPSLTE